MDANTMNPDQTAPMKAVKGILQLDLLDLANDLIL